MAVANADKRKSVPEVRGGDDELAKKSGKMPGISGLMAHRREWQQQGAAGFEVFLTVDQGIEYQQNLITRKLAIIILRAKSNRLKGPIAARACLSRSHRIYPTWANHAS